VLNLEGLWLYEDRHFRVKQLLASRERVAKSVDNPDFRSQRGRLRACVSWAKSEDRAARTAAARRALMGRFENEVDPERTLTVKERVTRAEFARKAHFQLQRA
jgi:hypothetical protein